jgi:hypothetical protein
MSYEYTPYPESIEKARQILELQESEIFSRLGNYLPVSQRFVGTYYFAPNAKGLQQSEWFATWKDSYVEKVARWIDRQPVNVTHLAAIVVGAEGTNDHIVSLVPVKVCSSLVEAEQYAVTQGSNYVFRYNNRLTPRVRVLRW